MRRGKSFGRLKILGKTNSNPFGTVAKTVSGLVCDLEKFLKDQANDFEPEVKKAAARCITSRGKKIRPLLVFCAARDGEYDKLSLVRRAAIAEMIHLSSLIHDDVIDGATLRRNEETPNTKYGIKTAVLLGDAIFAHTMILTFKEHDEETSHKTVECVKKICEGEISQSLSRHVIPLTDEEYEFAVRGKTSALFSLACFLGARARKDADKAWAEVAYKAGDLLGTAYQIYDDACDWFMSEENAGKTLGTDLISGKQTFPLLALMKKLTKQEAKNFAANFDKMTANEIGTMLEQHEILEDCKSAVEKRIMIAEQTIGSFKNENEGLLDFCCAMKNLFPKT